MFDTDLIDFVRAVMGEDEKKTYTKYNSGLMYLLHLIGSDAYKVGVTTNIDRRLENLQTGCPYQIEPVYSIPVKYRMSAHRLEAKILHQYKPSSPYFGEWLKLTPDQYAELINTLELGLSFQKLELQPVTDR